MNVTTLAEIRAQAEPQVVEIPGFRPNATLRVKVRLIDLTPKLMQLRVGNPLLAEAQKLAADGMGRDEIAERVGRTGELGLETILPLLDEVAREALVEPSYEEITQIQALTLAQKMRIWDHAAGTETLLPFREK